MKADELLSLITDRTNGSSGRPIAVFNVYGGLLSCTSRLRRIYMDNLKDKQHLYPGAYTLIEHIPPSEHEFRIEDTLKKYEIDIPGLAEFLNKCGNDYYHYNSYGYADEALTGAVDFSRKLVSLGIAIYYLYDKTTGLPDNDVLSILRKRNFPLIKGYSLFHPVSSPEESFNNTLKTIRRQGDVLTFFDRDPARLNIIAETMPGIIPVLVGRYYPPDSPLPADSVRRIKHYEEGLIRFRQGRLWT